MAEEQPASALTTETEGGEPTAVVPPTSPTPTEPYDWRQDIHPDVKESKVWDSIPDLKTLTKAYADSAAYSVGALKLPAANAPPEEWDKVWDKLGRPSAPEGYVNTHDDPDHDPDMADKMKGICYAAGVTAAQWRVLALGYNRIGKEKADAEVARAGETTRTLKEEYGAGYEPNLGLAQRAIRTFGGEETMDAIVQSGLGNDVGFIRMMMKVGKALSEQKIITANVEGVPSTADAKALIDQLTASKEYLDAQHPLHKQTVEKVTQLFEIVYN